MSLSGPTEFEAIAVDDGLSGSGLQGDGQEGPDATSPEIAGRSLWAIGWRHLRRDKLALAGGVVIVLFILLAVFAGFVLCHRMKFSGWGRALRALREDEVAAAAVGVDPTRYKVTSFVLAAAGAGVAGGLLATMHDGAPATQPDQFGFQASFDAITMVILGGSGSVSGATLGALFVTFTTKLFEFLQSTQAMQDLRVSQPWLDLNALRMVSYAATLIAVMIVRPEGVLGEREIGEGRKPR